MPSKGNQIIVRLAIHPKSDLKFLLSFWAAFKRFETFESQNLSNQRMQITVSLFDLI